MVADDILTQKIEAAVLRAMAAMDSDKQKVASMKEVIKETDIHSQVSGNYNVFQVKPMYSGPPPPYEVIDFKVSEPPVGQRRTDELEPSNRRGRTADRSSSDAPAPDVPPPAPMAPSSGTESPEQDDYVECDALEHESEGSEQPIDPRSRCNCKAQQLSHHLQPHRTDTGSRSSSSWEESSHSGPQQQQNRKETSFLFSNRARQTVCFTGRLDTGADGNFISPRAAREVAHSYHSYRGEPVTVANGVTLKPECLIFTSWAIENIDSKPSHDGFIVFNNLPCDVIIGEETIKRNDILVAGPKYKGCFILRFTSPKGK